MISTFFQLLGEQLLAALKMRGLRQPALAESLGLDRERLSELVRDFARKSLGRHRLTLFADLRDTLDRPNADPEIAYGKRAAVGR